MNVQECANCATYGWKQVEDTSKLQKCKNCELIFYCGKKKVHKSHCKYFKDPSMAQQFYHRKENCFICLMEHPNSKLKQPHNPNYMCTMDLFMTLDSLKQDFHPHPFSAAGEPGDTMEKAVIVLEHLVFKLSIIQAHCDPLITDLHGKLLLNRCVIWRNRKMFPRAKAQITRNLHVDLVDRGLEERNTIMLDPFQMWKSISLVEGIFLNTTYSRDLKAFKDPFASLNIKFHSVVEQALENSVADEVLEALATQVVPFEQVLKIICGGSLKQRCSFCSDEVVISGVATTYNHRRPIVIFNLLFVRIYGCGRNDGLDQVNSMIDDFMSFMMALTAIKREREANLCDYCFQLPLTKDVHRCGLSEPGLGDSQARLQEGGRGREEDQGWLVGQEGGGGGIKEGHNREAGKD